MTNALNAMVLVKGEERYIFLYADDHQPEVLRTLGRFASNPELSFSWYDAAVLSQRIRQAAEKAAVESALERGVPLCEIEERLEVADQQKPSFLTQMFDKFFRTRS